ncbi:MAG TPA: Gfo/Idh/MocA family oxidoreductase [Cyclobacteriaceae bacterium]|nr:Gfo/Idh/MocA family oxidoreductase [Cyclobacteriaceae bacterium]
MDIGIIGLGDIAMKAYLPVITTRAMSLHLCSRNEKTLSEIAQQYRIANVYNDVDSLIRKNIKAAFVHTATSSHEEIVRKLLDNNVHVYVDKPVTDRFDSTFKLVSLAEERKLLLRVGFNRRYAPSYRQLKDVVDPNMIVMQKNRRSLPGEIRTFVFDDFIHVADTLLFLLGSSPKHMDVTGKISSGLLHHLVVKLTMANGATAIGIMNRDAGTTEERIEVFSSSEKRTVINMAETIVTKNRVETKTLADDWEPMLRRRGFENIIDSFLEEVRTGSRQPGYEDVIATHSLCEQVVNTLSTS